MTVGRDRLPTSVCLGFGVGTIGVSIMINTVTVYFPAFMSTVLGRNTALAGTLLMVSKLYDAVADVVIGTMSDRTRSRWGRRRPFLLAGALVSALSFLMIFSASAWGNTGSDTGLIVYLLAALVLYSTGYSLFNVPYLTMPSEMTSSRYERSRLLSFRTVFVSIGQTLAIAGAAALIARGGGGARGYLVMAWVAALVIAGAMLLSFVGTARAPAVAMVAATRERASAGWRDVFRNRPFCLLMGAKVFQFLAFASNATASLLFMLNILHLGYGGQVQLSLAQNIASALSMPAWLWLERRTGKRNAYLVGIGVMVTTAASWLLVGRDGVGTAGLILRGIGGGVGSGGMLLLSISMLSDTFAHDREVTGLQREGLLSSIAAVIEKTSFAIGLAVIGLLLSLAHYAPTTNGALVRQPASAIQALYACYTVIPLTFFLCNAACIWFYTLGARSPEFGGGAVDPEPVAG